MSFVERIADLLAWPTRPTDRRPPGRARAAHSGTRPRPGFAARAGAWVRREFLGVSWRYVWQGIAMGSVIVLITVCINKWLAVIAPLTGAIR